MAAALAEQADHGSVTTSRLAGTAEAVASLNTAVVDHLVAGELPQYLFEGTKGTIGIGSPDSLVGPSRGGLFVFTDRRVFMLIGTGDGNKTLSLCYEDVETADYELTEDETAYRLTVATAETDYYPRVPPTYDADDIEQAVEYARYKHKTATPDSDRDPEEDALTERDEESIRERLERLGEARRRELISEEEYQKRRGRLLDLLD
jgi:hypothetical protein